MAMRLGTSKRLLTRYTKKLEAIITHLKNERLETLTTTPQEGEVLRDNLRQLNEGIGAITAFTEKIEKLLREYATDVSSLEGLDEQELSSFEEYSAKAEEVLASAFDYLVLLQSRRQAHTVCASRAREASNTPPQTEERITSQVQPRMGNELPALPIPIFRGNIWEWDNFWELFNANIHSQPLPELYKFNYLKNAVRGEAYQAIEKFQVTSENYTKAIEFLLHKYGDKQVLITRLLDKLEKASLKSPSLRDQRALFEELQVIVAQLAQKGEQVDSQWCVRQILSKFPLAIQRKVLLKRNTLSTGDAFRMEPLLKSLEEVISDEEMVSLYMGKRDKEEKEKPQLTRRDPTKQQNRSCMYCKEDHKSFYCTKYKTPQERSRYLRERKLCLICASAQHRTSECKKRLCFKCQGAHHTSCCFKTQNTAVQQGKAGTNSKQPREIPKRTKAQREINVVSTEGAETEDTAILQVNSAFQRLEETFLPTGELTVLDPKTNALRKVAVLLDTGAEISFIDKALAEELQLPIIRRTKLHLHTFGSNEVSVKDCQQVKLNVWDDEGQQCSLSLLTHDILTKAFTIPELQDEDIQFIKQRGLVVNHPKQSVKPEILLGADQLWPFIRSNTGHICLPSGLYLLSTRMGYLLTGQPKRPLTIETKIEQEEDRWNGYWSLEAQVNTIESVTEEKESEQELWEKFWKLDAAGTEEFGRAEKTQQAIEDQQVWDNFKKTVEKRPDGYYVRLPWKELQGELPDNKAIAHRRLTSLWNSLQKDEKLLDQYNGVFQEQLRLNILEEVNEESRPGARIHYIPHQAVITPHKSTTKLRIVYDASAHYRGSPSLNDVLYRGPVILPLLYGIILRFRVGHIAMISDVEKAFLQVRLHEKDRDATRCLWLRNHKQPPSPENIRILRFTRVTFGLMPSPFLLAATTHYHLDQYKNSKLVKEMKENLYVDNLILSTDQTEEAIKLYHTTKGMFQDLKMNLREFVSNDKETMQAIASKDRSSELAPKVLGIKWDSAEDAFTLTCRVKKGTSTTKRTVASSIASVYDPIGYLTPLLHKAKVFLRSLWQQSFDWDTSLPRKLTDEWEQIIQQIDGFEKLIPRCLCSKKTELELIAFADASSEAISTCVYLRSKDRASLLIAKGKLPALKSTITMPKMELNAATLAMRVANATITQLKSVVKVTHLIVLSDSEIALQWIKSKPQKGVGRMITSRLAEINKIMDNIEELGCQVWFAHVASSENPADCATRGLSKTELINHFWWTGPPFLRENPKEWKNITLFHPEISGENEKTLSLAANVAVHQVKPDLFNRLKKYSWASIKRIIAYVLRYIRIAGTNIRRNHPVPLSSWLRPDLKHERIELDGLEIAIAAEALIRQHQTLITQEMIRSMRHLNIQKDKNNLLRCYGRLGKSTMNPNAKQPLVILQNTWLAEVIIKENHNKGHASINHTISLVRQNYWIPKLRAQVTRVIRRCVPCQKFNNLPFKYPEQSDLPQERVQRARPFEHVGLDYFGPLSVALSDGTKGKCYGCIITCMVTRLIHLDIAQDLSTKAFLLLLRRFFGRRGIPRTITSDNAPTFLLGETILRESYEAAKNDPSIMKELSDKEIVWKHITPYAPWQGGFYERLIKSVKLSLYKTLGNQTLATDELTTVVVEIEALLNTRPLLYMETDSLNEVALRPIDFLQNEMQMKYPVNPSSQEEEEDPSYVSSEELALLRTKKQTIEALQSSCKAVEKFWQVWQTHYLTSLREKHQKNVGQKRGSSYEPHTGDVVMIADPIQPRQAWKLGRIIELVKNQSGIIREASVMLPSRHKIRRPVNLLVPLELEQYPNNKSEEDADGNKPSEEIVTHPYNLRPNRKKNYTGSILKSSVLLAIIMGLLFSGKGVMGQQQQQLPTQKTKIFRTMKCISGGITLISETLVPYQVCAEDFCITFDSPQYNETVRFPPNIVLHEHKVQWKLSINNAIEIMEAICPSASFCESVDCLFCASLIFNPECWPVGAIIAITLLLYLIATGCYALLYVPLVVGKPVRLLVYSIYLLLRHIVKRCRWTRNQSSQDIRRRRRRSIELTSLLAISTVMSMHVGAVHGCQMVNIFSHTSTLCTNDDKGQVCKVQVSEILKLNPFKREACFKLMQNETTVHQIRTSWKNLLLTCEKVTDYFTRDTSYEIVDSKRCPHVGSCVGSKCAQINTSSLIPELALGNGYPGNTYCVESCGGPGCDCFYWSSGCLFYRIYLTPVSSTVYEVFHCNRWAQTVAIDFTHFDAKTGKTNEFTALMLPNVPVRWESFSFTLSSVSMAPIPLLQSSFITDGNNTALWDKQVKPALRCPSSKAARALQCEVYEQCTCNPAETKANCKCLNVPILKHFKNLQQRMPVILPSITFEESKHGVKASVQNMLSTEIIVTLQEDLRTNVIVDNDICTVENTQLIGCYNCEKGAYAKIKCFSSRSSKAEIICEGTSFTAPCGKQGIESIMRVSPTQAMVRMKCSVSCGEVVTTFEVGGVLKYTATFEAMLYKWLTSNSESASAEIKWPDLYHLFDVFSQWYKTVLIAVVALIVMLGVTYAFISTCGLRCIIIIVAKLVIKPIRKVYQVIWRLCFWTLRTCLTKKGATKIKL